MPSSSPGEGSRLSGLRRRIAKISKSTARSRLKFLRRSKSQSAASSSSYSDRLTSLTQSAEHYPHLKALADIVTVLYSNVNRLNSSKKQRAFGWRSIEILEAVAEAIPDPSEISPEMCMEISHLTTLFCDINRYFDSLLTHPSTPLIQLGPLRSQLDDAYSKFARGKEPRTLKTLRIFRVGFSMASVADILTTTLRVIDRASDVFPPLKSTVGGALAFMDVTQGVHAIKTRAQQLRQNISNILDIIPSDSVDFSDYLKSLHHMLQQLDELELHKQSFFMRLRNLNRNNELLSTSQADVDRGMFYSLLIRAFRPPESSRFPRTKDYVFFSASLAFF
ncbi:hypothetical protein K435DRAFT_779172 [Dendrothele bispora CBS 962.96]|uniref:Fungal STAND N-terminal Goodbye domain-containing protein n=1 Tax=Dendrothele bispora (strain CBS 962.96) TaxID=1314807 RepID=A0A4S8LZ38_DENBC|nr:hypothetical protein K435DRAFT_779172 [Dendrothele bispora CBS 962.96]